jgi:hypothetical protein
VTAGLWLDLSLAIATAILWVAGIAMFLTGAERAEHVLMLAFLVGLAFCVRTWWRSRRDPDGPSLLQFFTDW